MKQPFNKMLLELNAFFGDKKILPTSSAQLDAMQDDDQPTSSEDGTIATITDLDTPLDDESDISIEQIIQALQALQKLGINTVSDIGGLGNPDGEADTNHELDNPEDQDDLDDKFDANPDIEDPSSDEPHDSVNQDDEDTLDLDKESSEDDPEFRDLDSGDANDDQSEEDKELEFGTDKTNQDADFGGDEEHKEDDQDLEFGSDDKGELGDAEQDGAYATGQDSNKMGSIRVVKGAHLVYKRQQPDGTFKELWIYNLGDHIQQSIDIKKAIIAGTDIPDNKMRSEDGTQSYELVSLGNAQLLAISGLSN